MMTETEVTITLQKGCANVIPNRVLSRLLGDKLRELPAPRYTPEELAYGARMAAVNPEAGRRKIQQFRNASPAFAAFVEAHGEEPILNYTLPELPGVMQKDSSTDVGDVSWVCPTAELLVCTMAVGTGGHTWQRTAQGKSAIAHKGMLYAGKLLAAAALDLLTTPELVEDARREWRQQLGGRVYAPLPEDVQPNGRKTET